MALLEAISLEAVCGCELVIPVFASTEPIPGTFGVRIRLVPVGRTWDEVEEMLLEACDACVEP